MAFHSGPTQHKKAATDFRSISDQEFARLSTQEKLRHIHLGMVELTQTLVELAAAAARAARVHGAE